MFADFVFKAIKQPSLSKARRTAASASNGVGLNGHNGASIPIYRGDDGTKRRRGIGGCLCKPEVAVWLFAAVLIVFYLLSYTTAGWMWKNQYLYFNCPEKPYWQRPPDRRILKLKMAGGSPHPPRVHYISAKFGVGPGDKEPHDVIMKKHAKAIRRSGVFTDHSKLHFYSKFPEWVLKDSRWPKHLEFRSNPKHPSRDRAGYGFWKPLLIDYHLRSKAVRDGDFVVYTDPGRVDSLSWIGLLIETMILQNADLALEQMPLLERQWTKGDAYKYFCQISGPPSDDGTDGKTAPEAKYLYPQDDTSLQYNGSFLIVRRNSKTLQFIGAWVWSTRDYAMLSDLPSKSANAMDFKEHRHDQSFLSLLLKCRNREPEKAFFPHTCLGDRNLYTFRIDA